MFRKFRFRFIGMVTVAVAFILTLLFGLINSTVYIQSENSIQTVLSTLTSNDGELPITKEIEIDLAQKNIQEGIIYNFQYFSAARTGNKITSKAGNSQSISSTDIENLAKKAFDSGREFGLLRFNKRFFSYQVSKQGKKDLVVFLETTSYIRDRYSLAQSSFWIALSVLMIIVLITSLISGFAIRPFLKNYEKQRMFITNAGHELKTPLAIIAANTELQEMMTGENEWTESTKQQTERLSKLIARLIRLSRLEEQEEIQLVELNLSDLLQKVAKDHSSLIQQEHKQLTLDIEPNLIATVSEDEGYELFSILMDNARKYCDEKGTIHLRAYRTRHTLRRRIRIDISNDYADGARIDYKRFFDRFYRAEASRNNNAVAGYGIGLSMAEHLTNLFKGRISVSYKNGVITFTVLL